jgi:hypothetical protein
MCMHMKISTRRYKDFYNKVQDSINTDLGCGIAPTFSC